MSRDPGIATDSQGNEARIVTLDVVRGVAVMGILGMNIVGFAMPEEAYSNPLAFGTNTLADQLSWLVSFIILEGKMRGLFSFLFGASILLVIERADAAGADSARIHLVRMAWLLWFGLVHFYFIWSGDILSQYAPLGMAAWLFAHRSPPTLLRIGAILILVQTAIFTMLAVLAHDTAAAAAAPDAPRAALLDMQALAVGFVIEGPQELAETLSLYRGGFFDIAAHRLTEEWAVPMINLVMIGWETLGYMLLGMAALKSGFLSGGWSKRSYVRVASTGVAFGIGCYALLAWAQLADSFSVPSIIAWNFAATTLVRPAMIAGYAALIILLAHRRSQLVDRIAAAGRAAFTNYLGTSLVMTWLFYGWGLGWFGTMGRASLWLVVLPMWAAMLLWSKPWLDRFRFGPFEWLWRSLARGRPQAFARSPG